MGWYQPKTAPVFVGVCRPTVFGVPNKSNYLEPDRGLSNRYDIVRCGGIILLFLMMISEPKVPSPLGEKIHNLRKQKKLSLDQLAELTDSSKSYIWELENKDAPNPSADKIAKLAVVLEVTTEFLLTENTASPDEKVVDEAFFRKYQTMPEDTKKKIRKILDAWNEE